MPPQYFLPPDEHGVRVPAAVRWARASKKHGHHCHDDGHASTDYIFHGPKRDGGSKEDKEVVALIACGTCWEPVKNPGVRK